MTPRAFFLPDRSEDPAPRRNGGTWVSLPARCEYSEAVDRRSDYFYELPPELIAQVPSDCRDGSRLLAVHHNRRENGSFADFPQLIPPGSVIAMNDVRVRRARLHARKPSGGKVELLVVSPLEGNRWRCMAKSSKPMREGLVLTIQNARDVTATVGAKCEGLYEVAFSHDVERLLSRAGEVPLPPYIQRQGAPTEQDVQRYQTVYAAHGAAIAAPTAGLHFTQDILEQLTAAGHTLAPLTLDVGLGTFAPMRADDLAAHKMHTETYRIPQSSVAAIQNADHVVAVGTTCVRALEAAALAGAFEQAATDVSGSTELFIRPGFVFRVVDHLLTNFHLPESTLLMLVSAFAGYERTMSAYRHAVCAQYRFYSYGDAMYVSRQAR